LVSPGHRRIDSPLLTDSADEPILSLFPDLRVRGWGTHGCGDRGLLLDEAPAHVDVERVARSPTLLTGTPSPSAGRTAQISRAAEVIDSPHKSFIRADSGAMPRPIPAPAPQ
jgi:hypothetical protein